MLREEWREKLLGPVLGPCANRETALQILKEWEEEVFLLECAVKLATGRSYGEPWPDVDDGYLCELKSFLLQSEAFQQMKRERGD